MNKSIFKNQIGAFFICGLMLLLAILACSRPGQEHIIYVTATFPGGARVLLNSPTPDEPTQTPLHPTPDYHRSVEAAAVGGGVYKVQPDDTLAGIAAVIGIPIELIMQANARTDPNTLQVGQTLMIPD